MAHDISHLEALRQLLALPPGCLADGAMHFRADGDAEVIAMNDIGGRLLLLAGMSNFRAITTAQWRRLVELLSDSFDGDHVGRLLVLGDSLAMGWTMPQDVASQDFAENAVRALQWWLRVRHDWRASP